MMRNMQCVFTLGVISFNDISVLCPKIINSILYACYLSTAIGYLVKSEFVFTIVIRIESQVLIFVEKSILYAKITLSPKSLFQNSV